MKLKILFLTMTKVDSLQGRGIYIDLLKHFRNNEHEVFVISPNEGRLQKRSSIEKVDGITVLNVSTLKLQKTNLFEKGISQLSLEYLYLRRIKKNFSDVRFDLILYSTPPITFSNVIRYIKKRDGAFSYLLLKDIFPQNAVDMKFLKKGGFLYSYFRRKETDLYKLSDMIGCMSQANKNYIQFHNQEINPEKIEINPNTITPIKTWMNENEKFKIRAKHNVPQDKKIFIYGGNLGIPQGIDFLLETVKACDKSNAFFLIVGSGTEYEKIDKWFKRNQPANAKLLKALPKDEFDKLISACHVGLIFLHKDFTIPNFPSRLLSYLEMKMPVIAATDPNTDIGNIIENANCGYWVKAGNLSGMVSKINEICSLSPEHMHMMGVNAYNLLREEYQTEKTYNLIQTKVLLTPVTAQWKIHKGIPVKPPVLKKLEQQLG